jgi:tRNA (mo5U34)-methyltransferase
MTLDDGKTLGANVAHWRHAFEICPGLITPGTHDPSFLLDQRIVAVR